MLAKTLGADGPQTLRLFIFELRFGLITALVSGFSRAISEVGAVMIVGGNIEGKTRVMTTYISQLKGMGNSKGRWPSESFTADFFCDEFGALSFPEGKES